MVKKRIIIDTDIGDDVDDAFAIALALKSPEIEVVGITTVYKNTAARAEIVMALLETYNRCDIPVYVGCGHPLDSVIDTDEIPSQHRKAVLINEMIQPGDAVDFLINEVRSDPDLIIVGIGPMTNLAQAFKTAPEIMRRSHLVLMGGAYSRVFPEWNILCDPEAAKIVLESEADITVAGLDITAKLKLGQEDLEHIVSCKSKQERFLSELMSIWYKKSGFVVLHDPLMIAYLINPDVLQLQPSKVCVELSGDTTRGVTYRTNDWWGNFDAGTIKVADYVEVEAVVSIFINRVFGSQDGSA